MKRMNFAVLAMLIATGTVFATVGDEQDDINYLQSQKEYRHKRRIERESGGNTYAEFQKGQKYERITINAKNDITDLVWANEPSYVLSTKQIMQQYKANKVAFIQKYKGKIVEVYGVLDDIERGYVSIGAAGRSLGVDLGMYMYFDVLIPDFKDYVEDKIKCRITSSYHTSDSEIAQLQKGQKIRLKGIVNIEDILGAFDEPVLEDCIIVKEKKR